MGLLRLLERHPVIVRWPTTLPLSTATIRPASPVVVVLTLLAMLAMLVLAMVVLTTRLTVTVGVY